MLEQRLDQLIAVLRADGLEAEANALHTVVHEMVCTTGSEYAGEIGLALRKIRSAQRGRLSPAAKKAMAEVYAIIGRPLPFF